jgi:hypothetical protein
MSGVSPEEYICGAQLSGGIKACPTRIEPGKGTYALFYVFK